jgi:hypothetical protein
MGELTCYWSKLPPPPKPNKELIMCMNNMEKVIDIRIPAGFKIDSVDEVNGVINLVKKEEEDKAQENYETAARELVAGDTDWVVLAHDGTDEGAVMCYEAAEALVALGQLFTSYDYLWRTEYQDKENDEVYGLVNTNDGVKVAKLKATRKMFEFPTYDDAKKFLKEHISLIEEAALFI